MNPRNLNANPPSNQFLFLVKFSEDGTIGGRYGGMFHAVSADFLVHGPLVPLYEHACPRSLRLSVSVMVPDTGLHHDEHDILCEPSIRFLVG